MEESILRLLQAAASHKPLGYDLFQGTKNLTERRFRMFFMYLLYELQTRFVKQGIFTFSFPITLGVIVNMILVYIVCKSFFNFINKVHTFSYCSKFIFPFCWTLI